MWIFRDLLEYPNTYKMTYQQILQYGDMLEAMQENTYCPGQSSGYNNVVIDLDPSHGRSDSDVIMTFE